MGEYGMGGANSGGQGQYFYLPTASGPMPIAAEIDGLLYAIHSDHLNTPRQLTQQGGQPAWQWAYSAYGDEAPTLGANRFTNETTNPTTGSTSTPPVRFNLRYPGQYFDEETGLHYNWHRSYDPRTGRYTQSDPIGLDGGWNRMAYVEGNPLIYSDPAGLDKTIWSPGPNRGFSDGPRNGNWGGGKWSGGVSGGETGNAPPVDSGDECYMRHDQCFDSGTSQTICNQRLVDELKSLLDDSKKWPRPPRPGTEGDSERFRYGAIRIFGR